MAAFSAVTAWLNWAFSLVVTAAFLPFVVRANPRADFRLLVACAYLGLGTVWHGGLSGSAPLIIATPNNFLIQAGVLAETIPIARTLFAPFNPCYTLAAALVGILAASMLTPPKDRTMALSQEAADRLWPALGAATPGETRTAAERLEQWPGWSLLT